MRFLNKGSWANVRGLMSVGHERLIRPLGTIPSSQLTQIKAALSFVLDL